jgi:hypothetical protein
MGILKSDHDLWDTLFSIPRRLLLLLLLLLLLQRLLFNRRLFGGVLRSPVAGRIPKFRDRPTVSSIISPLTALYSLCSCKPASLPSATF